MAREKNTPEQQAIINEYQAATRAVKKFADDDKSPAANAAHKRFKKADNRRWNWR